VETKYSDTELKIRDAAKSLFLKKGYSATTTRDIAQES
jgi:AcrR family transcriptional regulator